MVGLRHSKPHLPGAEDAEDPQGKHRPEDSRSRTALLYSALFVGACLGFLTSQTMYLRVQRAHYQPPRGQSGIGMGTSAAAATGEQSGKPVSELEALLTQIAPDKEVMIAISNYNLILGGQLNTWLETVQQAKVPNYLVVAIDAQLHEHLQQRGINVYYKNIQIDKAQEGTGDNHAISALKFKIIREFLELGWNVLLSDVDIVVVQNPFDHLHRDHDVEGMSDGFDEGSAYGNIDGIDDPSMGWARYAQGTRHLNMNSGLFYVKANARTIELMTRIADRLSKVKAWDQSVYNEEIFFLSHGAYKSPNVSVRVMDIYKFMNSKVLFKTVRFKPRADQVKPVMVHINYHPDKHERMKAAAQYYLHGDDHALDRFPGGSEPGS
ncbi:hypothetical protein WJX72_009577 [[Myrmecia] bisecta]|uniref:Glycosyltransferase n=1 Tax=[Myrmecia] bisecta TaxID=41462 RepID=A0AAW1QSU0_9CHLO